MLYCIVECSSEDDGRRMYLQTIVGMSLDGSVVKIIADNVMSGTTLFQ